MALGLAELLSRRVPGIGVFRPLVADAGADPMLDLLRQWYRMAIPREDLFGVTVGEAAALVASGHREDLVSRVVERYRALARNCDAVIVVGSDFDDGQPGTGGLPRELAFNARLATEFGSVVVAVVNGSAHENAALEGEARSAYHSLTDLGATVVAVVVNRAPAGALVVPALPVPVYVIPEVPTVSAPTVAEVAAALRRARADRRRDGSRPRRARLRRRRRAGACAARPPDARCVDDHPR